MRTFTLFLLSVLLFGTASSQIAPNTYLVKFTDKENSGYSLDKPEEFLSTKALARRQRYNISLSEQDLPVNNTYVDSLKSIGFEIYAVSKWFNSAVLFTEDSSLVKKLTMLDFILPETKTERKDKKKVKQNKLVDLEIDYKLGDSLAFEYGLGKNQIMMLNGQYMHNRGYTGKGITIAVLDAGFLKVDELPAFDSLHANNQILGFRDFVARDGEVYDDDSHGMQVLSTIGGNYPEKLVGTAPKADFWLLRTEDESSEYIVEEYYWVSGAEFADSLGVDMIHTSLGYNDFDDGINSHSYDDMNGDVAPISIGADIASSKGILVVTSAGNEGNDPWKYISAPADADSVLSVGAVGSKGQLSGFSSRGPSADGRIKPDVMAQGSFAFVQGNHGSITFSFGTSFSGPIMAGAVACLWQAHPTFSPQEIIEVVRKSCHQYEKPDGDFGYGIPNMAYAHEYLNELKKQEKKYKDKKPTLDK
ncbi:MAG: S8 family serine peptidase [Bacteroidota bacterium]|nr:S8 family serine peptidase [Bacteroidota bacterium]